MREFFRTLARNLAEGPAVLVTALASHGSTPRGAGAMLAVFPDGTAAGSVGGGAVEYEAQRLAASLFKTGENARRDFQFRQGEASGLGMVCGGGVTLHFQYLPTGDGAMIAACRRIVDLSAGDAGVWLARRFQGDAVSELRVLSARDGAAPVEQGDNPQPPRTAAPLQGDDPLPFRDADSAAAQGPCSQSAAPLRGERPSWDGEWFSVPVVRPGRVLIFGGGHVGAALTPLLAALGFRVTVCDDRPEFASPQRFPQAAKTLWGPFPDLAAGLKITSDDYVVVMTRGHQADYEVLEATLRSGARYIGCIGSKRKLALCRDRLLAAGFTAEEYARLHAPIGLPIGAETPEEIAVSVAAELIAVRSGFST